MDDILKKYKERLINLSGRNRSLVCKTLPKKRAFDLFKLTEFNEEIIDLITEYIIKRDKKSLLILPDYSYFYNEKSKSIKDKLMTEFLSNAKEINNSEIEIEKKKKKYRFLKKTWNNS